MGTGYRVENQVSSRGRRRADSVFVLLRPGHPLQPSGFEIRILFLLSRSSVPPFQNLLSPVHSP